jgi:hypothetical protein
MRSLTSGRSRASGRADALFRRRFVFHTHGFEHVGPLSAVASMTMLQVLAEMVGSEELLGLVALAKLVNGVDVFCARVPFRRVGELCSTVAARVSAVLRRRLVVDCLDAEQGGTGPGVTAEVQRVLVSFGLVLVLEPVRTVEARVLLLSLVVPADGRLVSATV